MGIDQYQASEDARSGIKSDPNRAEEPEYIVRLVGQVVKVRVEGDTTVYDGRIVRVSPAIDEQTRSLRVEAQVGNEAATIRPGSFATADIIVASAKAYIAALNRLEHIEQKVSAQL